MGTPALWDGSRPFDVQGHRGAKGLRPENTLSGIACALEIGVVSIECDVTLGLDDAVVLSHDAAVRPPGAQRVVEPDPRRATLGGALATLDLFAATDVRLDVEIKSARHSDPHWDAAHVVERVVSQMHAGRAVERCSLRSFDADVLQEARARDPQLSRVLLGRVPQPGRVSGRGIRTRSGQAEVRERSVLRRAPRTPPVGVRGRGRRGGVAGHALVGRVSDRVSPSLAVGADFSAHDVMALAREVGAVAVAPGRSLATADLVAHAHAAGLPVIPWTVNKPDVVRALLEIGVDGVCTDRPDVVRATLAARGVQLPRCRRAPAWLGPRRPPHD